MLSHTIHGQPTFKPTTHFHCRTHIPSRSFPVWSAEPAKNRCAISAESGRPRPDSITLVDDSHQVLPLSRKYIIAKEVPTNLRNKKTSNNPQMIGISLSVGCFRELYVPFFVMDTPAVKCHLHNNLWTWLVIFPLWQFVSLVANNVTFRMNGSFKRSKLCK